jgi:pimeloyl-ACP methyl ester carboxylesterase
MSHDTETRETLLMNPFPLAYEKAGKGTPLILLHGFPLDRTIWKHQIAKLSEVCEVIAPDLRGLGKSPAPKGAYAMNLMARDVIETLNELRIEKAVWAGHSMGGYILLEAWRHFPERFSGIALVATHHLPDTPEGVDMRYKRAERVSKEGSSIMLEVPIFAEKTPMDADFVVKTQKVISEASRYGVIGGLMAMAVRADSTETLKTITVPTLVLGARGDRLITPQVTEQMAALIPNAQLIFAEEAGHMPMLEEPDTVSRALSNLILRVNHSISK